MGIFKSIGKAFGNLVSETPFGGLFDSFSGRSQQNDANRMAMKSWNLANDYNHPINQMERLKSAGLNPLLVYGSGSVTGNTTGAPSLVGGGISTPLESSFKGINNIMATLQGNANLQNTRAQTQASIASAGASGAQAANLNAQTAINEAKSDFARRSEIADINYKEAMTKNLQMQNKKNYIDVGRAFWEASSAKSRAQMDAMDAAFYAGLGGKGSVGTGLSVLSHLVRRY